MKHGMKKVLTVALLSMVVLFLTSCGTSSQIAFHEEVFKDPNDAIVYVYRLSGILGAAVGWSVKLDGKEFAVLKQKAYAVIRTTPGEHIITVGEAGLNIAANVIEASTKNLRTFTATPNGVYFFRCKGGYQAFVTREEAMKEIVEMKYDMGL